MSKAREAAQDIVRIDSIELTANSSPTGDGSNLTGITATQVGAEPADSTILKDADIGTKVLAPNGDGSGLTNIDSLPTQAGNAGKYLKTDGTTATWETTPVVDAYTKAQSDALYSTISQTVLKANAANPTFTGTVTGDVEASQAKHLTTLAMTQAVSLSF